MDNISGRILSKKKIFQCVLFLSVNFLNLLVYADVGKSISDHLYNRQLIKQSERWSIQRALSGQPKVNLREKFFAMNKKTSLFEFKLSGSGGNLNYKATGPLTTESENSISNYELSAVVWIVGVEASIKKSNWTNVDSERIKLRVLGSSEQDTHFNATYGVRNASSYSQLATDKFKNQTVGGDLTVYLSNQIGVRGIYDNILAETNTSKERLTGSETALEIFFEYGAFRPFVRTIDTQLNIKSSVSTTNVNEKSTIFGLALFF